MKESETPVNSIGATPAIPHTGGSQGVELFAPTLINKKKLVKRAKTALKNAKTRLLKRRKM